MDFKLNRFFKLYKYTYKTMLNPYRCFSFGIGSGVSTHLVKGIAEAGRGTAEFVTSGERMQPKVRVLIDGTVQLDREGETALKDIVFSHFD